MKRWIFIAMVFCAAATQAAQVGLIKIDGAIGPATANYFSRAIDVSAAQNDECLIIQLDTPGGLLQSTKEIVEKFYSSKIPTVVYVAPSGASAASAGVFITLAADVAAMAPNTTIGAAHPIELGSSGSVEQTDDVMKKKLENYASSFIEAIADKVNRNVEWAKSAVIQSVATTSEKALKLKVIDLIAKDIPDLLKQLDGRIVNGKTLHTMNAAVAEIPMTASEHLFQLFWQPEVMMLLMLIAIYGIIAEISHPGAIFPGVAGAMALILMLYMSATLPVNIAGLALILLAITLFVIDIFAPTHGVLTGGGIISFFLGAIMLFNHAEPGFGLPLGWIIPATLVTAAFFVFVIGKGLRAQSLPPKVGKEILIGKTTTALSRIDSQGGRVFIEGEHWNAVSDVVIKKDELVEITGIEGLTLKVKLVNREPLSR